MEKLLIFTFFISFICKAYAQTDTVLLKHFNGYMLPEGVVCSDIDSAIENPLSIHKLLISDSCGNVFFEKLNKLAPFLHNLKEFHLLYSEIDYYPCLPETLDLKILELPNIEVFHVYARTNVYLELLNRQPENLKKIYCGIPDDCDAKKWQQILYKSHKLEMIYIESNNFIDIDSSIVSLKNLSNLTIFSNGGVSYPQNFHQLTSLSIFDLVNCECCTALPEPLPPNLEGIFLCNSGITSLMGIEKLSKLQVLVLTDTNIVSFPENFDFSKLTYFYAPKRMFSESKWKEIFASCKGTVYQQKY